MSMFEKDISVLFVSHSLQQVERLCNKAILLEHGKLIAKAALIRAADMRYKDRNI